MYSTYVIANYHDSHHSSGDERPVLQSSDARQILPSPVLSLDIYGSTPLFFCSALFTWPSQLGYTPADCHLLLLYRPTAVNPRRDGLGSSLALRFSSLPAPVFPGIQSSILSLIPEPNPITILPRDHWLYSAVSRVSRRKTSQEQLVITGDPV